MKLLINITSVVLIFSCLAFSIGIFFMPETTAKAEEPTPTVGNGYISVEMLQEPTKIVTPEPTLVPTPEPSKYSKEDVHWLYKCVEAENGDLDYRGKYLTACCIINRSTSMDFPGDTLYDVIFANGQFDVVSTGRIYTAIPSKETKQACDDALKNNTDTWCIAFSAGDLHSGWLDLVEWNGNSAFYKERGHIS